MSDPKAPNWDALNRFMTQPDTDTPLGIAELVAKRKAIEAQITELNMQSLKLRAEILERLTVGYSIFVKDGNLLSRHDTREDAEAVAEAWVQDNYPDYSHFPGNSSYWSDKSSRSKVVLRIEPYYGEGENAELADEIWSDY